MRRRRRRQGRGSREEGVAVLCGLVRECLSDQVMEGALQEKALPQCREREYQTVRMSGVKAVR